MPVQNTLYATDGSTRTYPQTKYIAGKEFCRVFLTQIADGTQIQLSPSAYQLINNAVVLNEPVSTSLYKNIEIRVADIQSELGDSLSDIATVAALANDIPIVAGIENEIQVLSAINTELVSLYADKVTLDSLYANKTTLDTLYANINAILTVNTNIDDVVTVATNDATNDANIGSIGHFADIYSSSTVEPATPTTGDLWFDENVNLMKVYDGQAWILAGSSITSIDHYTKAESDTQLALKANLLSPTFTGSPTAPTVAKNDKSTKLATMGALDNRVRPIVSQLSKSGSNGFLVVINDELYSAHGNSGAYTAHLSGRGNNGQCGFFGVTNLKKVEIQNTSGFKTTGVIGDTVAFALMNDGELYTWGYNRYGQCALGHANPVPVPQLAATGILEVYNHPSMGEYNVDDNRLLVLKSDGLYAAGYNAYGNLGIGNTTTATAIATFTKCVGFTNTSNTDILKVFPIGNAYGATFVLTSDGKIYAAGKNDTGQLGLGTTTDYSTFQDVTNAWAGVTSGVLDIKVTGGSRFYGAYSPGSEGSIHMLITLSTGTKLRACGHNGWGQLGDGTTTQRTTPIQPINIPEADVVDIAGFGGSPLSRYTLCSNGDLWVHGYNTVGNLGDGTVSNKPTPAIVQNNVTKLWSDGMSCYRYSYHNVGFIQKADGLYGTGFNDQGYIGTGLTNSPVTTHTKTLLPDYDNDVVDLGHFAQSNNGWVFVALTSKGNLYTWGYNGNNGIHDSSTTSVLAPVQINLPIQQG